MRINLTVHCAQTGTGILYEMCKKAMVNKNYKELDDTIRQRLPPYLYNGGQGWIYSGLIYPWHLSSVAGEWIHCAHIACIRNSIRPASKQFPFIRELDDPTTFRFAGTELLAKLTEGHSPETHPDLYTRHCWDVSTNFRWWLSKSVVILLTECLCQGQPKFPNYSKLVSFWDIKCKLFTWTINIH